MKSQQLVVTEGAAAAAIQDDLPVAATPANQEVTFLSSVAAAAESSQVPIFEENKQSVVVEGGAPDVGILSKNFFKNKGREQPTEKLFAIHRKKRAVDVDVDVGILGNGRRRQQHTPDANLHDKNKVTGRSLQSEDVLHYISEDELPLMCPGKKGGAGSLYYFDRLFNETDGYFPKCSCPSPTTCGPQLCECLELDADGDILQCIDPLKQLCEGTMNIDGVPGPWSMEECLGDRVDALLKWSAMRYCSWLPCFVDGGSIHECTCSGFDNFCTKSRDPQSCAKSKCCQAQTDDEGRETCLDEGWRNYYDEVISFNMPYEEMISRFSECNSGDDKSIVQCYCDSFSYGLCVNTGVQNPYLCEAMNCCWEQTEDDARLDCFSRFRIDYVTGFFLSANRDAIQESCVASGKSSDQCKCDIHGLSNCVYVTRGSYNNQGVWLKSEPNCDLFQCCQSQTGDEGRKYCLVHDEAQLRYGECINDGNMTESCICDKSKTLCSSGHSNDRHCELSSCCQEQSDDTGRKECIENFTTSQPSSAPSDTPKAIEDSKDEAEASSTAASALPGTSSASIPTLFGAKSPTTTTSKMLAVAVMIGWLLSTR